METIVEAADSLIKASTPQPFSTSKSSNWVAKNGGLPPYVQHIAHALVAQGKSESEAISLAIGIVRRWATGGGKVDANTRAAAKKAVAEFDALRARAHAKSAGKRIVEAASSGAQAVARAKRAREQSSGTRAVDSAEFNGKHPRVTSGTGGGRFVRKGSSGEDVRRLQRRVGAKADGQFGDQTAAAVRRFQRQHGLKVDGIVGRQTAAALRGNRDAKSVAVGALTQGDREFLRGGAQGSRKRSTGGQPNATSTNGAPRNITAKLKGGGTRKVNPTEFKALRREGRLVEAVAHPSVLSRVQGLEKGEHAMLADGHAVRHVGTLDGRDAWQVGRPRSWSSDGISWDEEQHSTAEKAVAQAMTRSASNDHPDSVGGDQRWHTYTPVTAAGRPGEYVGADAHGQPLVRLQGSTSREPVGASWTSLARRDLAAA